MVDANTEQIRTKPDKAKSKSQIAWWLVDPLSLVGICFVVRLLAFGFGGWKSFCTRNGRTVFLHAFVGCGYKKSFFFFSDVLKSIPFVFQNNVYIVLEVKTYINNTNYVLTRHRNIVKPQF